MSPIPQSSNRKQRKEKRNQDTENDKAIENLEKHFPWGKKFQCELMKSCWETDQLSPSEYFKIISDYEKSVDDTLRKLDGKPNRARKLFNLLQQDIQKASMFADLNVIGKGSPQSVKDLLIALGLLLKHLINALLIATFDTPDPIEESCYVYSLVKQTLNGSSEAILDTLLSSNLVVPGQRDSGVSNLILRQAIQQPNCYCKSSETVVKFLALLRKFEQEFAIKEEHNALIKKILRTVRKIPLHNFVVTKAACQLYPNYGQHTVDQMYNKIKTGIIITEVKKHMKIQQFDNDEDQQLSGTSTDRDNSPLPVFTLDRSSTLASIDFGDEDGKNFLFSTPTDDIEDEYKTETQANDEGEDVSPENLENVNNVEDYHNAEQNDVPEGGDEMGIQYKTESQTNVENGEVSPNNCASQTNVEDGKKSPNNCASAIVNDCVSIIDYDIVKECPNSEQDVGTDDDEVIEVDDSNKILLDIAELNGNVQEEVEGTITNQNDEAMQVEEDEEVVFLHNHGTWIQNEGNIYSGANGLILEDEHSGGFLEIEELAEEMERVTDEIEVKEEQVKIEVSIGLNHKNKQTSIPPPEFIEDCGEPQFMGIPFHSFCVTQDWKLSPNARFTFEDSVVEPKTVIQVEVETKNKFTIEDSDDELEILGEYTNDPDDEDDGGEERDEAEADPDEDCIPSSDSDSESD